MQHLKGTDISSRLAFSEWAIQHDCVLDSVWFSDEAHFTLHGYVNEQNVRFWGCEKPDIHDVKPLHGEKLTVRAALSSKGIIGPYSFQENGETVTLTSDRYINIFRNGVSL